ncbi:hypothetical protein L1987_76742 [Smallanthus sonchifolius]|uniref:Uncharacterized protein n=1 Tax=Smallanthus sonchifolius TaxID=185202 RepID=A0ACB8ZCF3_9ASTR|nr:hypothetical protein L1987_76742 [Smallanthus sonchifolius]
MHHLFLDEIGSTFPNFSLETFITENGTASKCSLLASTYGSLLFFLSFSEAVNAGWIPVIASKLNGLLMSF